MRILHTADWHLGRTMHGVDLTCAHAAYLDHLVELARAERVDAVLVAGDVYDRAFPSLEAVGLLHDALVRLCEVTRVVITPGNHDSAIRLGFGSELFSDRLSVRARPLDAASPVVIPDAHGAAGLLVYPIPYLDPDAARVTLADWHDRPIARSHEASMQVAVRRAAADLTARRASGRVPAVAMAHAFVAGGAASDSERDIRVGGVDSIPAGVFRDAGFDYVALGHLHGPQRIGSAEGPGPVLRYAGSPVAMSFSERHQTKSTVLLDVGEGLRHELIAAPVERPLSEVTGTLSEVTSRRFAEQRGHYVRVVVTGEQRPHDLVTTVKRAFPHALEIHFSPAGGGALPLPGLTREASDPMGVLDEFVSTVRRTPPSADERRVLRQAYEAVRRAEAMR